MLDVTMTIDCIGACCVVKHYRLTNADEMRSETTDRVFSNVRCQLTARGAEQENPKIFVQVLHPKWNIISEEFQLAIIVHAELPPDEFGDDNGENWDAESEGVKHLMGHC